MFHSICADMRSDYIAASITDVPDYPKKGVVFRDITSLLANPKALKYSIDLFHERYQNYGLTQVVAIEARGFIFAAALADRLGIGLTLLRKQGKLPRPTFKKNYQLEYGDDCIEIHQDALNHRDKVIIMDDLLATGGTIQASIDLVKQTSATLVEAAFVIELLALQGRQRLIEQGVSSYALLCYE